MRAVPAGSTATVRVRVVVVTPARATGVPVTAMVELLDVYRGGAPAWKRGSLTFVPPLCGPAAVAIVPGADLVLYGPGKIAPDGPVRAWTSHANAATFDRRVR